MYTFTRSLSDKMFRYTPCPFMRSYFTNIRHRNRLASFQRYPIGGGGRSSMCVFGLNSLYVQYSYIIPALDIIFCTLFPGKFVHAKFTKEISWLKNGYTKWFLKRKTPKMSITLQRYAGRGQVCVCVIKYVMKSTSQN